MWNIAITTLNSDPAEFFKRPEIKLNRQQSFDRIKEKIKIRAEDVIERQLFERLTQKALQHHYTGVINNVLDKKFDIKFASSILNEELMKIMNVINEFSNVS